MNQLDEQQSQPPRTRPSQAGLGDAERSMRQMSRRSFTFGGLAALLGLGGWSWLRTRAEEDGIPWPLRRVLDFNARLAQAYFKDTRQAPTFPLDRAGEPRVNGGLGLEEQLDPARWQLRVESPPGKTREFSLKQIKALPRVEMVTELKCIEGWSNVVHWAGARFIDFVQTYGL